MEGSRVHALIVYAHPEPTSFTAALKDAAVTALTEAGHGVDVSDLYGEGFDPVAGRRDFTSVADPARFHYQTEQAHASVNHGFAAEIVREQQRIARAQVIIFVFPSGGADLRPSSRDGSNAFSRTASRTRTGCATRPVTSAALPGCWASAREALATGSPPTARSSRCSGRLNAASSSTWA
ncbi:MAG: hypothetical protein GEV07_02555 [Streptosporangiales bacterium]|nr:hypothetical protein [Streptosporangiales bacterium]